MASRIAVIDKGAVQQIATPSELYEQPATRFVADFIGKVNLIDAKVLSQSGKSISCDAKGLGKLNFDTDKTCGDNVAIAVRPEKLKISKAEPKARRPHQGPGQGARCRLLWRHQSCGRSNQGRARTCR